MVNKCFLGSGTLKVIAFIKRIRNNWDYQYQRIRARVIPSLLIISNDSEFLGSLDHFESVSTYLCNGNHSNAYECHSRVASLSCLTSLDRIPVNLMFPWHPLTQVDTAWLCLMLLDGSPTAPRRLLDGSPTFPDGSVTVCWCSVIQKWLELVYWDTEQVTILDYL